MEPRAHSVSLGLGLALTGLAALVLTRHIDHARLSDNGDPGPQLFPFLLGGLLVVGGLVEAAQGLPVLIRDRRRATGTPKPAVPLALLVWGSALAVYIVSLPWAGFALATFVLVTGLLIWQRLRWWVAVAVASGLVGVVYVMFVLAFKVPLPTGVLGI